MAKILCKERVVEYTKEYKAKVVELTDKLDVKAIDIADVLGLHPIMVYRWRQEYREGKLVFEPSRRVSMTTPKEIKPLTQDHQAELKQLKKQNARMQREIDVLKKWQGYLAKLKQKDSNS
jgi:transposase